MIQKLQQFQCITNEILIWKPCNYGKYKDVPIQKRLKGHKGVIFSIDFDVSKGVICSTSDDRSAILWTIKGKNLLQQIEQSTLEIAIACQVYGHLSRIFRCCILENTFATASEDSFIIIWNFDGKMLKKIETHQLGTVWVLDYDKKSDILVSGGGNSGVSRFRVTSDITQWRSNIPQDEVAKLIGILNSGSIVCFSERACVYYQHHQGKSWQKINQHTDLESYVIMQVSNCKKKVALAGYQGQIYIYKEINDKLKLAYVHTVLAHVRVYSFHWLTCQTFLICQEEGVLTLLYIHNESITQIQTFSLPVSKERWSTCACSTNDGHIVVGDRMGNIHLYILNKKIPISSLKKVHDHLGVVNLYANMKKITSLGRNGILNQYLIINKTLQIVESTKTKLSWLASIVDEYLLSFSGKKFVISDLKFNRVLFDIDCGGGHRSWAVSNICSNNLLFCFIKDKSVNCINLDLSNYIISDLLEGYHSKEINALETISFQNELIVISGGEDTTLKINSIANGFKLLKNIKIHLSSIRALAIYKIQQSHSSMDEYLLFSAGGRAQIICWHISFNTNNEYLMCTEKCSYYKEIDQELPEIRIMDLVIADDDSKIVLYAACSDGNIKVFSMQKDANNYKLRFVRALFHKYICITRIRHEYVLNENVLVTAATDGHLVFWNVSDILLVDREVKPSCLVKAHDSGINSLVLTVLRKNTLACLTGGDDNKISFTLYACDKSGGILTIYKIDSFEDKLTHCAQVTGAYIFDDYFVTSSIDQRIAIFKWEIVEATVSCKFVHIYNTSIADVQGLKCQTTNNQLNVIIFGKGVEYVQIQKSISAN
ncbi:tRNA (34-2'-O)-methyltransferase regulator WDR6 isoform X2 [Cylas formicarius]|uniref:tRNA (34-2'-O)-methyltransferase regulator WDR6 isoform X2 n=1 Tax=Cylas formicarius TaxID=197179 RepID=UPI002958C3B9|nr:tRNA (34-2'-O)-methyltransferase regulator WDR6 isoform X2 [Cylas formicarius]